MGIVLHKFANGWDESPVTAEDYYTPIKSIGNSTTTPRDLENDEDVKIVLTSLSESVCEKKWRGTWVRLGGETAHHLASPRFMTKPSNT